MKQANVITLIKLEERLTANCFSCGSWKHKAFGQGSLTSSQYCFPSGYVYSCECSGYACIYCVVYSLLFPALIFLFCLPLDRFLLYRSTLICCHSCAGALMYNAVMNFPERKPTTTPQGLSEETLTLFSLCLEHNKTLEQ